MLVLLAQREAARHDVAVHRHETQSKCIAINKYLGCLLDCCMVMNVFALKTSMYNSLSKYPNHLCARCPTTLAQIVFSTKKSSTNAALACILLCSFHVLCPCLTNTKTFGCDTSGAFMALSHSSASCWCSSAPLWPSQMLVLDSS